MGIQMHSMRNTCTNNSASFIKRQPRPPRSWNDGFDITPFLILEKIYASPDGRVTSKRDLGGRDEDVDGDLGGRWGRRFEDEDGFGKIEFICKFLFERLRDRTL